MLPRMPGRDGRAEVRRRRVTMAGHRGDAALARRGLADPDPGVQVAALGALARLGELTAADVESALGRRRRRRCGGAPSRWRSAARGTRHALVAAPRRHRRAGRPRPARRGRRGLVPGRAARTGRRSRLLAATATGHDDARCREAAVAALGAIGDPAGLPAVLAALGDTPTVRRRATVALAGFDDPRVTPALRAAAEDRDWQVRQAADELLDEPTGDLGADAADVRALVVLGEEPLQPVEGLEADAGPLDDALERRVDQVHRHGGGVGQALGHAAQQRAAAGEVDALRT